MTLLVFCLILFSGTCSVIGQIFFKHAMSDCGDSGKPRRPLDLAGRCAYDDGRFLYVANALATL